jgi:hypothetical protein
MVFFMAIIDLTCPHCHIENVMFSSVGETRLDMAGSIHMFSLFLSCQNCKKGVVATVGISGQNEIHRTHGNIRDFKHRLELKEVYPAPLTVDAPEHTPPNIANFFRQAKTAFRASSASKNLGFDAAATMARKSIETACKHIDPDSKGSLYDRIESLAEQDFITPDMKDWAHEIRDIGNDGSHETEPLSKEDAEDVLNFTEMFLMYLFTLPGMLTSRRREKPVDPPS